MFQIIQIQLIKCSWSSRLELKHSSTHFSTLISVSCHIDLTLLLSGSRHRDNRKDSPQHVRLLLLLMTHWSSRPAGAIKNNVSRRCKDQGLHHDSPGTAAAAGDKWEEGFVHLHAVWKWSLLTLIFIFLCFCCWISSFMYWYIFFLCSCVQSTISGYFKQLLDSSQSLYSS